MAEIGKDGWLMKGSAWNEEDVSEKSGKSDGCR